MTLELFPFIEHHLKGQSRRCLRMLAKRGLIRRYGETKMNKVKAKTLTRQAEISSTCRSISHMNTDDLITDFSEFLTCLGNANTSEFALDRISNDFLYLNDIFE